MPEVFLGRECLESRPAHKSGLWLGCMVDSSSSSPTFKASLSKHLTTSLPPLVPPFGAPRGEAQIPRIPQLPLSSPLPHPPPSIREAPCPVQLWSPGTSKSFWQTETPRMGKLRKESAFKGLKKRQGLWEIMTVPSPTACKTNCKAHVPDVGFPL